MHLFRSRENCVQILEGAGLEENCPDNSDELGTSSELFQEQYQTTYEQKHVICSLCPSSLYCPHQTVSDCPVRGGSIQKFSSIKQAAESQAVHCQSGDINDRHVNRKKPVKGQQIAQVQSCEPSKRHSYGQVSKELYNSFSAAMISDQIFREHFPDQRSGSYTCLLCNRAFERLNLLRRHFSVHSEEKPFSCQVCDKAFKRSDHLASHARVHISEKPFMCTYCPASFKQSRSLRIHLVKHTRTSDPLASLDSMVFWHSQDLLESLKFEMKIVHIYPPPPPPPKMLHIFFPLWFFNFYF